MGDSIENKISSISCRKKSLFLPIATNHRLSDVTKKVCPFMELYVGRNCFDGEVLALELNRFTVWQSGNSIRSCQHWNNRKIGNVWLVVFLSFVPIGLVKRWCRLYFLKTAFLIDLFLNLSGVFFYRPPNPKIKWWKDSNHRLVLNLISNQWGKRMIHILKWTCQFKVSPICNW